MNALDPRTIMELVDPEIPERVGAVWRAVKTGQALSKADGRLARELFDHAKESFGQRTLGDLLNDPKEDLAELYNGCLHVVLHDHVRRQLDEKTPIEAFQFYNAMRRQKAPDHAARHLLAAVYLHFASPLTQGQPGTLDTGTYIRLLKKYKTRKPDRILDQLRQEPLGAALGELKSQTGQMLDHQKDDIQKLVESRQWDSPGQIQQAAAAMAATRNREPLEDFEGLTPEQMHRMIYAPFTEAADVVTLKADGDSELLEGVQAVTVARFVVERLAELQPLKATTKGNLPLVLVAELGRMLAEFPFEIETAVRSEEQRPRIRAIRHLLTTVGWIKIRDMRFSLTRSGERAAADGIGLSAYRHLLRDYVEKTRWAAMDLYPPVDIVQQSWLFSCYLLHRMARDGCSAAALAGAFVRAFPAALREFRQSEFSDTPEKQLGRVFVLRFVERFAEFFGLVQAYERVGHGLLHDYRVTTTPLFDALFHWHM